jgi:phosphohistidine phosphatase SixA
MVENIGLILVSPMRRTIQTALWSMDWLLQKGVPIQASAGWQGKQTT